MFNRNAFVDVCERSGFTMNELASIYGTTRQTVYDWRTKSEPTQLALAAREAATTKALIRAIQSKLLPFPRTLAKVTRQSRIDTIVKEVMESLKPRRT